MRDELLKARAPNGANLLLAAAAAGAVAIVRTLLTKAPGFDLKALLAVHTDKQENALHLAARNEHREVRPLPCPSPRSREAIYA